MHSLLDGYFFVGACGILKFGLLLITYFFWFADENCIFNVTFLLSRSD